MADELIRAWLKDQPVPKYETTPFVKAPPLSECTVAIISTAGLRRDGEKSWKMNEPSFRVFERAERNIKLGHISPNFDRSGFAADINVMYPIDRLEEIAAEGLIGGVAPRHISFMGAQDETMETIRMDTGPAAAKQLKEDDVNVALLAPV
ncbi:MAG: glycine/sarcosine/betaine reductase selenoprotein B family protein [Candidatus Hydrogenedentes bacterium]|jgi:D-proline reductase (dithiol) PrdB|nr:glycine/sarcosine/betaine reductase selenoprotein B family protein [Candidatus Hydrogenedentota bacterium]